MKGWLLRCSDQFSDAGRLILIGLFIYICNVDCLQSAFSLKIRQVLISASAIVDNDVTTWVTRGVIFQRKIRELAIYTFGALASVLFDFVNQ